LKSVIRNPAKQDYGQSDFIGGIMRENPFLFESEESEDESQFEDSFEFFENEYADEFYEGEGEDEYGETEYEDEFRRGGSRRVPMPRPRQQQQRARQQQQQRQRQQQRRQQQRRQQQLQQRRRQQQQRDRRQRPGDSRRPRPRFPAVYPFPFFSSGSLTSGAQPSQENPETVRLLQGLLNKALGLNLPLDGVMNVETRSAIRSFQNPPSTPANDSPPTGGAPVETGSTPPAENGAKNAAPPSEDKDKPQEEYDELGFYDTESNYFELEDEDEWNREYFELEDEDEWNQEYFEQELTAQPPTNTGAAIAAGSVQSLRDNMVKLAQQEWLRWGKGSLRESDPKMRGVLQEYWKTGAGQVRTEPNWWSATPWSAAFISWVIKKAGGGNAFRYSAAHSSYIKAAKNNRLANNSNPFRAYRINEISPQPGDLVCACRESCRANYDNVNSGMPTHCDIVTEKHPGYIITIGGNVNNTVGRKTVPTDERGFIKASNPKTAKYFTVIRAGQRSGAPPVGYPPNSANTPTAKPDIVSVRGIQVARQIAPQIDALLAAAEREGVKLTGGGYRSSEQQIKLRIAHCGGNTPYNIYQKPPSQCTPPTAPPGRSNHEKGLAIDFKYNGQGIKSRSNPGFVWLARNAAKYGLYNLPSEPWHWSVNGK
jgi:hypothetical protein